MVLMWEEMALEHELQTSVDALRKEMALMQEEEAREHWQQGAIGEVNNFLQNQMAVLPGVLKEECGSPAPA